MLDSLKKIERCMYLA